MSKKIIDLSEWIATVINDAFYTENYSKKIYDEMKQASVKRSDVLNFLDGNFFQSIACQLSEIDMYLNGAENLSEVYEWMGKERVINFKHYLENIILDVKQYESDRKPGRKKRASGIANK